MKYLLKASRHFKKTINIIKPKSEIKSELMGGEKYQLEINSQTLTPSCKRILLVSYYCPTRAHAGGLRILDLYTLIRKKCPNVQLDIFTHNRPDIDWNIDDIYNIFHNVYLSEKEELTPNELKNISGELIHYDTIDLQFHQCGYLIDAFKKEGKKIIYTPMESLSKSLFLEAKKSPSLSKMTRSLLYAAEELTFVSKVDKVVCVSKSDAAFLRAVTSSRNILGINTGISQLEFHAALSPDFIPTAAASRPCKILYIAYFGSETNVKALRWYLDHVHPVIESNVPDYVLTVVGRGDLSSFSKYRSNSVELIGEVPALAPYIEKSRLGIAPALGGAGFRGKVNQYSIVGIPSVVSPISLKGLSYKDGKDIFVADSPLDFSNRCIKLLTNTNLNDHMGTAARELCMQSYTWQSNWNTIEKTYNLEEQS